MNTHMEVHSMEFSGMAFSVSMCRLKLLVSTMTKQQKCTLPLLDWNRERKQDVIKPQILPLWASPVNNEVEHAHAL